MWNLFHAQGEMTGNEQSIDVLTRCAGTFDEIYRGCQSESFQGFRPSSVFFNGVKP